MERPTPTRANVPTEPEKAELRDITARLASYGYEEDDARQRVWRCYRGGIDGARCMAELLSELPTLSENDIAF